MKSRITKAALFLFAVLMTLTACELDFELYTKPEKMQSIKEDVLSVCYLDVGQGDSTYIKLPSGETMLIDAGEWDEADHVIEYIESDGVEKIDYLIGTHPHSDHIGGLSDIMNTFEIGKLYMPKVVHTSKTFENVLDAIEENNIELHKAAEGEIIYEDDALKIEFLAPVSEEYDDLNNYSAVIKIQYYKNSFLFMGDAEKLSENEIKGNVDADVLKVGHHGSSTSSSKKFLNRVLPKIAVISVGEDNSYGHPSEKVIGRLKEMNVKILRTDKLGDIVIESDGENINVKED